MYKYVCRLVSFIQDPAGYAERRARFELIDMTLGLLIQVLK